jgi:hypothetical protein
LITSLAKSAAIYEISLNLKSGMLSCFSNINGGLGIIAGHTVDSMIVRLKKSFFQ